MLFLPATRGHGRRVHRRRRGGPGGAVDDRQRHALPADAVRARGASRRARRSWRSWPTPATSRRASGRSRRSGPSRRRSPTCVQPMAVPGDLPAGGSRLPPDRGRPDDVPRPRRPRGRRRRSSSGSTASTALDARRPAARARRGDGPRAGRRDGVRPPRRAGSWSTSRPSTRARTTGRSARRGSRRSPTDLEQGDHGAYVNFVGDEGEERVRAAYPGATWDRLAAIKAPLRPDQPVPPQPERPARGGHGGMTCRIPSHATTVTPA